MSEAMKGLAPTDEVSVNEQGGKNSPIEYAFHLLPWRAVEELAALCDGMAHERHFYRKLNAATLLNLALGEYTRWVGEGDDIWLTSAVAHVFFALEQHIAPGSVARQCLAMSEENYVPYSRLPHPALFQVAHVFWVGAKKYDRDNWRKISAEDHMNHALGHIFGWLNNDDQDDHLGHAATRMLMALEMHLVEQEPGEPIDYDRAERMSHAFMQHIDMGCAGACGVS